MAQIRLARDSDAETIAAIYRPVVEATTISFETVPPDGDEIARRVVETARMYPWLVCERGGTVAGYAYASKYRVRAAYQWSVETSVYIDPRHRRCGVGRGLYVSLFRVLSAQGFFNAYAGITLPNAASIALHEAAGFKTIGVYERVGYKLGCLARRRMVAADPEDSCRVAGGTTRAVCASGRFRLGRPRVERRIAHSCRGGRE